MRICKGTGPGRVPREPPQLLHHGIPALVPQEPGEHRAGFRVEDHGWSRRGDAERPSVLPDASFRFQEVGKTAFRENGGTV